MKNNSIWQEQSVESNFKSLDGKIEADILIIGGGITGLTTAYFLKDQNKQVILIDKGKIGNGITAKTTAKITYLQGTIYQTLAKKFNEKIAKKYFDSQKEAINLLKNIAEKNQIDCDLEKASSSIFTMEEKNVLKINQEKELLEKWGETCQLIDSPHIQSGIKVDDTYVFHPLKYLNALQKNIQSTTKIFEDTLAYKIEKEHQKYIISTNHGIIKANTVIVACHYPFFLIPSFIPLKTYIKREYVNASTIENPKDYTAISIDNKLHSLRFYKNYVIYGSNQQRLTSKINYQEGYHQSREDFTKYFKKEPEYTWMNQDIMSNDSLPFIGEVEKNLHIATAYNAWGMTNGTIAAKVITDIIIKGKSEYQFLFNPKRMNILLLSNSFIGSFHYMKAYAQSLWKKSNPSYVTIKGISYGIYHDEDNQSHMVKLLCPHLKCHLVFNNEEKTWDCPCHGSRFDIDGNIIEGPATKKINDV